MKMTNNNQINELHHKLTYWLKRRDELKSSYKTREVMEPTSISEEDKAQYQEALYKIRNKIRYIKTYIKKLEKGEQ